MDFTALDCMEGAGRGKLRIWTPQEDEDLADPWALFFCVTEDHPVDEHWEAGAYINRPDLRRLRDALTAWLGDDHR